MELSELTAYAREVYQIEEQHKWDGFPGFSVLSHPRTGKWVALLMRQWDTESGEEIQRCDLKCGIEYTVRSGPEQLGTIVKPPPVGDKIAIAGRVWAVDEVDHKRREVYCTLVKGNIPAFFGLEAGDIHTRILERMRAVLAEDMQYPYLMPHAVCRLGEARETARNAGMLQSPLIHLGGKMWALFPWLGSYAFLALERFLKLRCAKRLGLRGLNAQRPYYMQFTMEVDEETFCAVTQEEAAKEFDPLELVYPKEIPVFEKYDEYVPSELVRKGFAYGVLDVDSMKRRVLAWGEDGGDRNGQ